MKKWRCKHCKHHVGCLIGEKVFIYCTKEHNYPSPKFIEAWGCSGYEKDSEQLSLFDEEKGGHYGNNKKKSS